MNIAWRKRPFYWLFIFIIVLPAIPFVLISLAIVLYANFPFSPGVVTYNAISNSVESLVFITHGKGDNAETWAKKMAGLLESESQQAISVDWEEGAKGFLRSSRNSEVIGESLANAILHADVSLKKVHFISHSAGAFMAYQFCKTLKSQRPDIMVHITYLDPLSIYRGFYWRYGEHFFGTCADNSEAIIHVGDGVPGSERPLRNVRTIDVTELKPKSFFNGHLWPVYYYMQQLSVLED